MWPAAPPTSAPLMQPLASAVTVCAVSRSAVVTAAGGRNKASKAHATDRAVLARNAIIAPRRPGKLSPTNWLVSPGPQRRNTRRDQDRAAKLSGEDRR